MSKKKSKESEVSPLQKMKCHKCGRNVLVSKHRDNADRATGMIAKRDGKIVGALCHYCAEKAIDFGEFYGTKVEGDIRWTGREPKEFHYHAK